MTWISCAGTRRPHQRAGLHIQDGFLFHLAGNAFLGRFTRCMKPVISANILPGQAALRLAVPFAVHLHNRWPALGWDCSSASRSLGRAAQALLVALSFFSGDIASGYRSAAKVADFVLILYFLYPAIASYG